jgi:hypothetical protein
VRAWSGRGLQAPLAFTVLVSASLGAQDSPPLHERIDRAVEAAHVGPPAPVADDAAFLRRAFLDLTGRIPSSREARAFLDDPSKDKRVRLVDRLLAGPEHVRHMAVSFDLWFMERRADKHVKSDEWRAWLVGFFAANRPYTELARDVLGADGSDPLLRPAARFVLDRDVAPDAITRDVARVFFGMDLQCAQCHDHPRIEDYLQRDYYGLYAFLSRASLFQPDNKKPGIVAEKAEGDVAFKSVFTKAEGATRPRLPDGSEIQEPQFPKGEEWQVKPDPKDKALRPVPKYSRRAQLARLAGEGVSLAFRRNVANRLWAHMMGRGLVEPLDLHHSENPPSHPELLEMLAAEFAAMKYDIRAFLRELALTRTYQRGMEMPASLAEGAAAAAARLPALEAESKRLEEAAARAEEAARRAAAELEAAAKEAEPAARELARAETAAAEARKARDQAAHPRDAAQKELAALQDLRKSVADAAQKASEAAARLTGDAELSAAAATFRARAEKLALQESAATKDLALKGAAVEARAASLEEAEKAAGAAKARRSEADATTKTRAAALAEAQARHRSAKSQAAHAARLAADTKEAADYGALQAAALQSRDALRRIRTEIALAKSLAACEARAAEAKRAHEAALRASEAAGRDLAPQQESLRLLSEASARAGEAAAKAAKDADLASAAARVKASRERVAAQADALRKEAARREDAARAAAQEAAAAERARAAAAAAKGKLPDLEVALRLATDKAAADQIRRDEAFGKLAAVWTRRFALGDLDPLTPEQICWSMMQAAGIVDQQRRAAEAELAKKSPPAPEADRARFIEEFVHAKLKGNEAPFVRLFGGGPGQPQEEFHATVDQALFLANGGLVRGWLAPSGGNLIERLLKTEDPKETARELYFAIYTRPPAEREVEEATRYLAARPQARLAALQEMAWAMLTSVEFRFRH